jgi:hypothetical protein
MPSAFPCFTASSHVSAAPLCCPPLAGAVLQPWDQDFYTRRLALSLPHHSDAAAAAAPYLRLGSVMQGLSQLLQRLMGLSLTQRQLEPGEGCGGGERGAGGWGLSFSKG